MGNLGVPELLIIAGVIILLFGARKLPEMARSIGKSAKAFKEETKSLRGEDKADEAAPSAPPAQQQLPQSQPPSSPVTPPVVEQPAEQQHKNAS